MAPDPDPNLVPKTESLLASVKSYNGDRTSRLALLKQMELLRLQIEDPMDSMISEWEHVRPISLLRIENNIGRLFSV
jgi:hypothetical protein